MPGKVPPWPFLFGLCVCQVASTQPLASLGLRLSVTVSGPPMVIPKVAVDTELPLSSRISAKMMLEVTQLIKSLIFELSL
jgi:hypothetical protein